jgi:hypothetical protein
MSLLCLPGIRSALFQHLWGKLKSLPHNIWNTGTGRRRQYEIVATLLRKASRGRHSTEKAREIKALAARSVGITLCSDAFAFQIKILIEEIEFTETSIKEIENKIEK